MRAGLLVRRFVHFLVMALAALFLAMEAYSFIRVLPFCPRETSLVFIKPHLPPGLITAELQNRGVLEERWKFKLLVRLTGAARKLRPGEYSFFVPSSPLEVLRILIEGKVILHRVTVPEGSTVARIGKALTDAGLPEGGVSFERLVHQPGFPSRLGVPQDSFEGFLFPDTYFFSRLNDGETILRTMNERFKSTVTPEDEHRANALGLTLAQWVTLASIIEKESGLASEQLLISSVFHNRLKKKMRLQSDPTVIYGIPDFNGNLTKKDLQTPTPYNTYTHGGLPPGPIANPGLGALKAAINPAKTDFFYFVARKDGTHAFSATYEEHERNVERYQLNHTASSLSPRNP